MLSRPRKPLPNDQPLPAAKAWHPRALYAMLERALKDTGSPRGRPILSVGGPLAVRDFCFGLLGIACFFFAFALIGHGLWLLMAALYRLVSGAASPSRRQVTEEECAR